jgi:hypothetical protein
MKIKTSELAPPVLDWVVAKLRYPNDIGNTVPFHHDGTDYGPSRKWAHGGPIVERESIGLIETEMGSGEWEACKWLSADKHLPLIKSGPTPLIAAMRCYVASRLGDEVDVPDELLEVA